ncbi:MAG: hypothetical protein ACM3WV_10475 [Bacillota bacterium]
MGSLVIQKSVNASSLPAGWESKSIGMPDASGTANFYNGLFVLKNSGLDIWGKRDQFQFAYMPMSGNHTIIARVISIQYTDYWAKAGIMIRESLDDDSTCIALVMSVMQNLLFQFRPAGEETDAIIKNNLAFPIYIKLIRQGNIFFGCYSEKGKTWHEIGQQTLPMKSNVYIGLASTSHNNAETGTAMLDKVTVI